MKQEVRLGCHRSNEKKVKERGRKSVWEGTEEDIVRETAKRNGWDEDEPVCCEDVSESLEASIELVAFADASEPVGSGGVRSLGT